MHPLMNPYESTSLSYLFSGDFIGFIIAAVIGVIAFWLFHAGLFKVLTNWDEIVNSLKGLIVLGIVLTLLYLALTGQLT